MSPTLLAERVDSQVDSIVSKPSPLARLSNSFGRSLRAGNLSPNTIESYLESVKQFSEFLVWSRSPLDPEKIRRQDVEAFITHLLGKFKPTTAAVRFRSLQAWFKWLLEEEIITVSPMAHMRPPSVDKTPPPVLTDKQVEALFKATEGKDFEARRDQALIRVFLTAGARRAEVAGLKVTDVDLDRGIMQVMGKGRRPRQAPLSRRAVKALDRYLLVRDAHPHHDEPWLWLGHKGQLKDSGIFQVVRRRARQIGLDIHPHQFRHTFAHLSKRDGHSDETIMRVAGWNSSAMLRHYGASAASERAIAEFRDRSPDDRF
jgi:site-specific recombinase XerD